tara:strand:+ start:466 stop:630 length:165 start_codon:yes stop_codon:yes gene_type:complete
MYVGIKLFHLFVNPCSENGGMFFAVGFHPWAIMGGDGIHRDTKQEMLPHEISFL